MKRELYGLAENADDSGSLWYTAAMTVLSILFWFVAALQVQVSYATAAESEAALIISDANVSMRADAGSGVLSDHEVSDAVLSSTFPSGADDPHDRSGSAGAMTLGQGIPSFTETHCFFLSGVTPLAQAQRLTEDHTDCSTDSAPGTLATAGQVTRRPDWSGLARDAGYFVGYQVVMVGLLYLLPESVTSWSDEQKDTYDFQRWADNVKNPVWDKDKWYLNYLSHPYWGATYYVRGRERGLSKFDSFLFSAFLSTLYEFGVEALFEPPSYQDLIVTPIAGSLLGLYFEKLRADIKAKGDAQKWYDKVALVLSDPLGAANGLVDRLLGIRSSVEVHNGTPPLQRCTPSAGDAAVLQHATEKNHCRGSYTGVAVKIRW